LQCKWQRLTADPRVLANRGLSLHEDAKTVRPMMEEQVEGGHPGLEARPSLVVHGMLVILVDQRDPRLPKQLFPQVLPPERAGEIGRCAECSADAQRQFFLSAQRRDRRGEPARRGDAQRVEEVACNRLVEIQQAAPRGGVQLGATARALAEIRRLAEGLLEGTPVFRGPIGALVDLHLGNRQVAEPARGPYGYRE